MPSTVTHVIVGVLLNDCCVVLSLLCVCYFMYLNVC